MADDLDRIAGGLGPALEGALVQAAEHAAGVARAHTKGELARSIRVVHVGALEVELVAGAPYAELVEHGRGAVQASPGKVLHFVANGRDVFAKRVGPAAPRPFMGPAAEDLELEAAKVAQDTIDSLVGS